MPCVSYTDPDIQNAHWEGFTQANEVSNLLVWNFHSELIFAALNSPGSWHDSRIAAESGFYGNMLMRHTPTGMTVLADSAFPRLPSSLEGKTMRSRKMNEHGEAIGVPSSVWLAAMDALLEKAIPSEQHSAEWDVQSIKSPFKRLTTTLPVDVHCRGRIISICTHLYNLRVRTFGLNQIGTVFSNREDDAQHWIKELL